MYPSRHNSPQKFFAEKFRKGTKVIRIDSVVIKYHVADNINTSINTLNTILSKLVSGILLYYLFLFLLFYFY